MLDNNIIERIKQYLSSTFNETKKNMLNKVKFRPQNTS